MRLTPVETGATYGQMTAIRAGLDTAALVATDHLQSLSQGQRVRVRRGPDNASIASREDAPPGAGAGTR